MELSELARLVLESSRIEDKLHSPASLSDERPWEARTKIPCAPARPPRLSFDDRRPRARFPSPGLLHDPEARGRALHFFANHELLAVELMAVCLLRFPEAPPSFRLGVGRTLLEEQDHLRRYRERMSQLGVGLGDVPVGGHFWRVLARMGSPLEYVAGMSMVFEQANLDHASRWMHLFREAEDPTSSELMSKILQDEIGHVRHGVLWFDRWRGSTADEFTAFSAALPPGLDPVRARGPTFEIGPRLEAGLSPAFIQRLRLHRFGKGRRPRLWVFWPDVEEQCAGRTAMKPSLDALSQDLAGTFGLLGSDDDVVWDPRSQEPPSPSLVRHLDQLTSLGLPTPRRIAAVEAADDLRPDEVQPWGWSPEVRRRLAPLKNAVRCPYPELEDRKRLHRAGVLPLRRHFAARKWLDEDRVGAYVESVDELLPYLDWYGRALLKAPYASSGRRRRKVLSELTPEEAAWAQRMIRTDGGLLVEPFLQKRSDFGLVIPAQGRPALFRFFTDRRGAYRGHLLASPTYHLDSEQAVLLANFPAGGVAGLVTELEETVREAIPSGPLGVDLMIEERAAGLSLHPAIEVNARYTMGHIALSLRDRLAPGRLGLWWMVRRTDLRAAGVRSFSELARRWSPAVARAQGQRIRLEEGVVPTNDPDSAQTALSVLSVGRSLQEVCAQLAPAAIHLDT